MDLLNNAAKPFIFFNHSKKDQFDVDQANDFMNIAYCQAVCASGAVSPNPFVGAVVVKDGKLLSCAAHKEAGFAHAELESFLPLTDNQLEGADLYVTLEPCSHYGKTPPCVKLIIEKKIARVFIGMKDPNPLVNSKGIALLQDANIKVYIADNQLPLFQLNQPFLKGLATKRSYLVAKIAITLDGKIATQNGNSKWISNSQALAQVDYIRSKVAGILIGENTLVLDNPSLTLRTLSKDVITSRGSYTPYRIALIKALERIDPHLSIFSAFNDSKTILFLPKRYKNSTLLSSFPLQKENFIFYSGQKAKFDFILEECYKRGINSILLEGGASLISQAFIEDAIDMGQFFIAPKIIGDPKAINPFNFSKSKTMVAKTIYEAFTLKDVQPISYGDNCSFLFRQKFY